MAVENMSSSASSSSSSSDSPQECPLCLETLDLDDRSFYPCTCGYQICRFCWHRILSESSIESKGSCPACRKPYSENPANFEPLSVDEVQAKLKKQRKQKESQKKQKSVDSRKHLGELRVVQKNLVFVVGITPRIADPDLLKKNEYFGRFGKIHKIVVNSVGNSGSNGTSNNSYGAYITYIRSEDALRAIQSVNNIPFDGKTIKASLGTTKYCSHFMRNQSCPKPDCMYLHAQGDPEASFTKEDMQQGKHQEYERKLIDEFNKEQQIHLSQKSPSPPLSKTPPTPPPIIKQQEEEEEEEEEEVLKDKEPEEEPPKEEENKEIVEELLKPTELLSLLDNSLDFDPFYETQKAFESIIQQEMQQQSYIVGTRVVSPPPGFCNNNLWQHQTQPQTQQPQQSTQLDEWIDPAIIYSSRGGGRPQQQTNGLGHLLGNSLLNEVFNGGSHQIGHQPPQQQNHVNGFIYPQQQQQFPQPAPPGPANFFFNGTSKFPPPPGFGGSTPSGQAHHHQQFINNNFFNNFPF